MAVGFPCFDEHRLARQLQRREGREHLRVTCQSKTAETRQWSIIAIVHKTEFPVMIVLCKLHHEVVSFCIEGDRGCCVKKIKQLIIECECIKSVTKV